MKSTINFWGFWIAFLLLLICLNTCDNRTVINIQQDKSAKLESLDDVAGKFANYVYGEGK